MTGGIIPLNEIKGERETFNISLRSIKICFSIPHGVLCEQSRVRYCPCYPPGGHCLNDACFSPQKYHILPFICLLSRTAAWWIWGTLHENYFLHLPIQPCSQFLVEKSFDFRIPTHLQFSIDMNFLWTTYYKALWVPSRHWYQWTMLSSTTYRSALYWDYAFPRLFVHPFSKNIPL